MLSINIDDRASMRPGRMPRKYHLGGPYLVRGRIRFNEAGADAPEILVVIQARLALCWSFNEAGADAPEILQHSPSILACRCMLQ